MSTRDIILQVFDKQWAWMKAQTTAHTIEKGMIVIALLSTIVLWASAFAGIRVALDSYTALQVAVLRNLIASIVLIPYAIFMRFGVPQLRDIPGIFLLGLVGFALYTISLNMGQRTVSSGAASFIISAEVAVISMLAAILFGERINAIGWAGIVLCIVGVGIISATSSGGIQVTMDALFVVIAMICLSTYSVMQKLFMARYSASTLTTYAIWGGTICLLPFLPDAFVSIAESTHKANIALIYLGIFPTVIAYTTWAYVISKIPASKAGAFLTIIPFVATIIAWLVVGEVVTVSSILGGLIIIVGVVLVNQFS